MLQILVLGSAAGGGFPQWNDNTEASRRARAGSALARTQSSIVVSGDGERWFLFNASPDLRQQINENPALHPRAGARHSPISSVVLTNADVDHVAGLLTLRERQPLALYASARVHEAIDANPIFRVLNPDFVARRPLPLDAALEIRDRDGTGIGLSVEAFAVPGKVALYLEDASAGADTNYGTAEGDTIGLCVRQRDTDAGFFYIPGCAALDPTLAARLKGARLVLFDGRHPRGGRRHARQLHRRVPALPPAPARRLQAQEAGVSGGAGALAGRSRHMLRFTGYGTRETWV